MKKIITAVLIIGLSACTAVPKDYMASGGSKADGTVKLSYTRGIFENVTINEQQGLDKAIKRCVRWGYTSAIAFEMVTSKCQQFSGGNCQQTLYTKEYQCE